MLEMPIFVMELINVIKTHQKVSNKFLVQLPCNCLEINQSTRYIHKQTSCRTLFCANVSLCGRNWHITSLIFRNELHSLYKHGNMIMILVHWQIQLQTTIWFDYIFSSVLFLIEL